ncbi:hypothetical protein PENSPDRAFT_137251 [Peniophora sp. CONT]|nr:hypothetical protein PENSPDRAFT_137251 [Peniophora sp. CONT]
MSGPVEDKEELMLSLDKLLAKYFQERDGSSAEKTSLHKFWGTYLRAMKDEDEARPRDWDGNTGNILTFTGLFAATVAAFLIEGYKMLSPDSGDQTVVLLTQLLAVTTNSSSNPTPGSLSPATFHAPLPAVLANALWFCSLVVALACALLATLVQQWSRDYVRDIKQRETLDETFVSRALNHVYIRMGVDRYGMDGVVYVIVALVHLAVILFAAGLLLFLYPINAAVAGCTTFSLGIFGSVYLIASITPIRDTSCPYRTPLTYLCALSYSFYQYARPCAGTLAHFTRLDRLMHWVSMIQHFAANLTPFRRIEKYWARLTSSRRFEPPDMPRKLEIIPTARRETRYVADTMSLPRFKFVWRRTSRHLVNVDAESLKILLQSILDILHSMPSDECTRFECLDHLLSDKVLASRLDEIGRLRPGSPDSDTCVATLKMACLLLRRTYTKRDMWSAHNDHPRRIIAYHLSALFSMIRNSEEFCHDALAFNLQRFIQNRPRPRHRKVQQTVFLK